jgi:hypothetical protein
VNARWTWRVGPVAAALLLVPPFGHAAANDLVVVGDFSHADVGAAMPRDWTPVNFRQIDRHTRYTLTRDATAGIVVCAEAEASASGLARRLDLPAARYPLLRWRWKAQNVLAKGDVTQKTGDDYPARVYVMFKYSPDRVSIGVRLQYATARLLYGEYPPHASIAYVWDTRAPVETTVPNAFSDRARMIVVETGAARLGQWLSYERDIVADYRRAYGEEPPPIAGIAIMTDADNTGASAAACYGDIELIAR